MRKQRVRVPGVVWIFVQHLICLIFRLVPRPGTRDLPDIQSLINRIPFYWVAVPTSANLGNPQLGNAFCAMSLLSRGDHPGQAPLG